MKNLQLCLKGKWFEMTDENGKEEWGAEPNKLYFIIKHGKRLL